MKNINPLQYFSLYVKARISSSKAVKRKLIGSYFIKYGHRLGWRLLLNGSRSGFSLLLNPVSSTRYFEFDFANEYLLGTHNKCLDVSSPRLFGFHYAEKYLNSTLHMINPDIDDLNVTKHIARKIGIESIKFINTDVRFLETQQNQYDRIWSISVVEHIEGEGEDSNAMKLMYDALNISGRLVVTVPIDSEYREIYRSLDHYNLGKTTTQNGKYFFQHIYDKTSIDKRLIDPIGKEPSLMKLYGEVKSGIFHKYEQKWLRNGFKHTVIDPEFMMSNFRIYDRYDDMPGFGVCALLFDKT